MERLNQELRDAILQLIRSAMKDVVEQTVKEALINAAEVWIPQSELPRQFGMFSDDWLKRYGEILPRTKAPGSNRWCYPRNQLQEMIRSGELTKLEAQFKEGLRAERRILKRKTA